MDELEEPTFRLENPISMNDLMTKCTEFSINNSDYCEKEEDTDISQVYPYDKLEPYCLLENLDPPSDDDGDGNDVVIDDICKSFPSFRKRMTNLTSDGKIMKLIEKSGYGSLIPDEEDGKNWIVYVHYAAYVEYVEYPFDATHLRHEKPKRLQLGSNVIGVDTAIRSMRKGEKAKFLIHPDLGFGEKGVPPRIPPQATTLWDIELFDYGEDTRTVDPEKPETLQDRIEKAKKCRETGSKKKKLEKNVNGAISQYRRGVVILSNVPFANEEEEDLAREELLKLYTNLAVCYSLKGDYPKVCSTYKQACHDCPKTAPNRVKLIYLFAKALRLLGDYDEAKKRLRWAQKLRNGDQDILAELSALNEAIKKHKAEEIKFSRNIFGFVNTKHEEEDAEIEEHFEEVSEDLKEEFRQNLEEFMESDEKELIQRNLDFTIEEIEFCKRECKKWKILFKSNGKIGNYTLILRKPAL